MKVKPRRKLHWENLRKRQDSLLASNILPLVSVPLYRSSHSCIIILHMICIGWSSSNRNRNQCHLQWKLPRVDTSPMSRNPPYFCHYRRILPLLHKTPSGSADRQMALILLLVPRPLKQEVIKCKLKFEAVAWLLSKIHPICVSVVISSRGTCSSFRRRPLISCWRGVVWNGFFSATLWTFFLQRVLTIFFFRFAPRPPRWLMVDPLIPIFCSQTAWCFLIILATASNPTTGASLAIFVTAEVNV